MPNTTTGTPMGRASAAQVNDVSTIFAQAFHDDPVFTWVVPDRARRSTALQQMFTIPAEMLVQHDETYLAGDRSAAALWTPPGVEVVPDDELETFGRRAEEALGNDAVRLFQLLESMQEHHPEEPHFYLLLLGVVPERQGRGLGSALLRLVLDRCDAEGIPAYLEATSVDNQRLYARHGFETVAEIALPDGPSVWRMWREPA